MPIDWSEFKSDRWSPDKDGDKIAGLVVDFRVEKPRPDERVPVLVLNTGDGSQEVWGGPWDLRTKLANADVQINDTVTIVFTGTKHTGQASPMKLFDVDVVRGDEKPFWGDGR